MSCRQVNCEGTDDFHTCGKLQTNRLALIPENEPVPITNLPIYHLPITNLYCFFAPILTFTLLLSAILPALSYTRAKNVCVPSLSGASSFHWSP